MNEESAKLKPGESVWCRLKSAIPGGYRVSLTPSGIEGFLPSHDPIDIGRTVPTTFVCMDGDKALLTYAFVLGTTARVQVSTASDAENAFSVWADSYPNGIRLRRAVDLFMPPVGPSPLIQKIPVDTAVEFFTSLENAKFTGVAKVNCQERLSRSATLFLEGRAVGIIYTTKHSQETYPMVTGLKKMMEDLYEAEGELEMYELPVEIVLSMSSLFLGYLDRSAEDAPNPDHAEKMLKHFAKEKATACLTLIDKDLKTEALAFVYLGQFKGAYEITDRRFSEDRAFFKQLLDKHTDSQLKIYILPTAMVTEAVRFGYSLNSEQFAKDEAPKSSADSST
jgi:hypothetical protein